MSKLLFLKEGLPVKQNCVSCPITIEAGSRCYKNTIHDILFCEKCGKSALIDIWHLHGMKNTWIKCAWDPAFTTGSFYECKSLEELISKFREGNWSLGNAFFFENMACIQQKDGGDEWLTILDSTPFDSISFQRVLEDFGDNQNLMKIYLESKMKTPVDPEFEPDYTFVNLL